MDMILISKYFNIRTLDISDSLNLLKDKLINNLKTNDGISDSINLCLNNLKYKPFKTLLFGLIVGVVKETR